MACVSNNLWDSDGLARVGGALSQPEFQGAAQLPQSLGATAIRSVNGDTLPPVLQVVGVGKLLGHEGDVGPCVEDADPPGVGSAARAGLLDVQVAHGVHAGDEQDRRDAGAVDAHTLGQHSSSLRAQRPLGREEGRVGS